LDSKNYRRLPLKVLTHIREVLFTINLSKRKVSMKALIKITPKFRPYSGELAGFRILAAIPNLAAKRMLKTSSGFRATNEDVPSFRAPYFIRESMDFASENLVLPADMVRFKRALEWEGFTNFEMVTTPDKAAKKLSPEAQAKIDAMLADLGFTAN